MSWYSIFYWLSVADSVKQFFDTMSRIFTTIAVFALIIWVIAIILKISQVSSYGETDDDAKAANTVAVAARKFMTLGIVFAILAWSGYVFCPTKKDALLIVAGGAVGNFITKDTAARQIPSEVMTLLRDKLRSEIKEIHVTDAIGDTLASKTKEELIEMYKNKK